MVREEKRNFFSRYILFLLSKYLILVFGKLVLLWLQSCGGVFFVSFKTRANVEPVSCLC